MSRSFSRVPSRLLLFSPEELRSVGRGSQLRSRLLSQLQRSWELATFWRTAAGRVFRTQFFCWSYFADSFSVRRSFVRCCFAVGHRRYVSVAQTISTESECVDSPLLLLFTEKSKTNWQQHLTKRNIELFENILSVSGLFYRQVKIVCFFWQANRRHPFRSQQIYRGKLSQNWLQSKCTLWIKDWGEICNRYVLNEVIND